MIGDQKSFPFSVRRFVSRRFRRDSTVLKMPKLGPYWFGRFGLASLVTICAKTKMSNDNFVKKKEAFVESVMYIEILQSSKGPSV